MSRYWSFNRLPYLTGLLVATAINAVGEPVVTFITGNKGKLAEAQAILAPYGIKVVNNDVDAPEIQELDPRPVIEDKIKRSVQAGVKGPIIVEDTSLWFKELDSKSGPGGLPGPLIKWFGKTKLGWDLLPKMAQMFTDRTAYAVSIVGYKEPDKPIQFFEGRVSGRVPLVGRGTKGFGWDPYFEVLVDDGWRTFAEMTPEQKNKVSMRKDAFEQLGRYLQLTNQGD